MIDYGLFYSKAVRPDNISADLPCFDLFVSAFNSSERVCKVFREIRAHRKIWLLHPEYQFSAIEEPIGHTIVRPVSRDEKDQIDALISEAGGLEGLSLCVDITGFMRHALSFLVAKLAALGVLEFTVIYSEPTAYLKSENTTFSTQTSGAVRTVQGMGLVGYGNGSEYLILGVGYDHTLIGEVCGYKDSAIVYPVFAFPSLSPDMYQQSAIRASKSGDVASKVDWISNRRFAPANDPFVTAGVIQGIVKGIVDGDSTASIYISPLSTKVQALGFALYWVLEGKNAGNVSMLFPECTTYARETSFGVNRLWAYTMEIY